MARAKTTIGEVELFAPWSARIWVMRAGGALMQGHWKGQTRFEGASGAQREHYLG